ncbi:MAG: hypothetical protein PWP37_1462 [Thermotogota bacterium]|nr:hypothetical protein [Thermotogota bacterium]MDK2865270.1 hypothetical protein [Thermotogota bacterium]
MKKLWKGYYDVIIFIVAFTSLLLWGCNPNPKNLFDRALSFSPQGFTTLERRIVASNITFDDFPVNDEKARMLHLKLQKSETETVYSVRLIECSNNTNAWKVYYGWAKQNFGTFKALLNAFPYLYGKISGMLGKEFYTVWVYAQRVYIINGPDEETVKELEKLFKKYIKGVEPSDMV